MINWKVRLKNKIWVASMFSLIVGFVYEVLAMAGITPRVEQNEILALAKAVLQILGMIGVVQDPTTDGMGDSERALGYEEPYKD